MRVLVTGAGGQLGWEVARAFAGSVHHVVAADHAQLDVADRDAVLAAVAELRPDAVVNTAAMTDVDGCEAHAQRAFQVNALGPRHLADAARRVGASVCHVSTDYVFSGELDRPWLEWDPPGPLSVYGRSKLAGESEVDPGSTVVRTSGLCSRHGRNFVKTMLRLATAGDGEVTVVDDQRTSPSFADEVADMIRFLVVDRRPGVFHVTNQGATSWYGFAREIFALAGADPARVVPVASDELRPPRPARRPPNSVLDNAALRLSGVALLADYHEPLERLVKDLVS